MTETMEYYMVSIMEDAPGQWGEIPGTWFELIDVLASRRCTLTMKANQKRAKELIMFVVKVGHRIENRLDPGGKNDEAGYPGPFRGVLEKIVNC
jgi:hypothetical protein